MQLHKWAIYWTNPSNSLGLGPLPRKHSLDRISPYPRLHMQTERGQYYHCPTLTLVHPLYFLSPARSPPSTSTLFFKFHLCSSVLLLAVFFFEVLLFFAWSAAPCTPSNVTDCYQRAVIWAYMSHHAIGCVPLKSVVTVSYYIVYLPERGSSHIQICSIWSPASHRAASLGRFDVLFIMSTVIPVRIALRIRTIWRKLS